MGYLYVMVRGLENIDKYILPESRFFTPWNVLKAYVLRLETES